MPPSASKNYHHGALRDALIVAAEALMAQRAEWTFTLREVAREAGVSHNAPYNHFADRRALLAAVAARSFDRLTAVLERTLAGLDPDDGTAGMRATAKAYVGFALDHPSSYRLMFSAELAGSGDGELEAAGKRAFAVLGSVIGRGAAAARLRPDPRGTNALAAWSLVHGFATLALDGRIAAASGKEAMVALLDAVSATLLDGLAVPATGQKATRVE